MPGASGPAAEFCIALAVAARFPRSHAGSGKAARTRASDDPISPVERAHLAAGFAAELATLREDLRLSQADPVARSGASERWIRELEHARARPSDDVCRRLAIGLLPDSSRLVQAMLDVRLRRLAGGSLRPWARSRPPRQATVRLYVEAERRVDQQATATRDAVTSFLDAFTAQLGASPTGH